MSAFSLLIEKVLPGPTTARARQRRRRLRPDCAPSAFFFPLRHAPEPWIGRCRAWRRCACPSDLGRGAEVRRARAGLMPKARAPPPMKDLYDGPVRADTGP